MRDCPARPAGCWTRTGSPAPILAEAREKGGFLTSLGGSPEGSSYKGYGLAVMVNILASCLSGSTLITDPMAGKKPQGNDIGHCFIAIDPGLFRDHEEFTADVTRFCNDLRATKPIDPGAAGHGGRRSAVELRGDPDARRDPGRRRPPEPDPPGRSGLRRALGTRLNLADADPRRSTRAGCVIV